MKAAGRQTGRAPAKFLKTGLEQLNRFDKHQGAILADGEVNNERADHRRPNAKAQGG